ncbi:MAG: TIGR00282 family metallophosphoesterase [Bacilli bacterium]
MKILFIGDIVGKIGRRLVKEKLPFYVSKYGVDFVIANGENVTHGKGLIERHYNELVDYGIDVITLGNHYNSKKEIKSYIDKVDRLIRPINIVEDFPGVGSATFEIDGILIKVTNVLGSAFMNNESSIKSPYYSILENIEDDEERVNIHIVDLHAEATGEKQCIAHALDGIVSAVIGTHTHVQTNDATILEKGTAFISDVGMTGFKDGVLGFDKEMVVKRNIYGDQIKIAPPDEGKGIFNAVIMEFDVVSGKALSIDTIQFRE